MEQTKKYGVELRYVVNVPVEGSTMRADVVAMYKADNEGMDFEEAEWDWDVELAYYMIEKSHVGSFTDHVEQVYDDCWEY